MASTSASMEMNVEQPQEVDGQFIRVIVADTQAIFRAGCARFLPWKTTSGWWDNPKLFPKPFPPPRNLPLTS